MKRLSIPIFMLLIALLQSNAQDYEWKVISQPASNALDYVYFWDSLRGWTYNSGNGLLRTTDGGCTWSEPGIGTMAVIQSMKMLDSLNGWAVGNRGQINGAIYKTSDGGKNWISTREIDNEFYQSTRAYSSQKNITSGIFYKNGNQDTGKVLTTTNGGTTWGAKTVFDSTLRINKTYCLDSLHIFIACTDPMGQGYLLHTTNGGTTWEKNILVEGLTTIFFLDTLNGWIGTFAAPVYRTYDGGKMWFQVGSLVNTLEGEPGFIDAGADGGITFLDSLNGWAYGTCVYNHDLSGHIQRTTDGGKTWKIEIIGMSKTINSVAMIDKTLGWSVSSDGKVLKYVPKSLDVKKLPELPKGYILRQNYPNPFNPATTIEYEIPQRNRVTVTVYDVTGKRIQTLVNEDQEAGVYQIRFNATPLSTGTYFYELKTETFRETKSLIIIK